MMGTMRFWLPNGDRDENLKKDYPLMNAPSNWDYTASRGLAGRETPTEKQHDHWRLGWNVPPPAVGMIEFKKSGETTASMVSTVVFISAGQQFFSDREKMGTFGSAVYVLSPVTGVGVWRRTAGNASNIGNIGTGRASVSGWPARNAPLGARDPVLGMMVTPPLAMYLGADQSPTPGEDYLRSVFTADHRGDIYEAGFCNERSDGTRGEPFAVLEGYDEEKGYVPHGPPNDFWSGDEPSYAEITFRRIGALRPEKGTDVTSCYAIPYQLTLQINGQNDIWLFGGTADLPTLQFSRVTGPRTGDEKKSGTLKNEKQYLFGLKRQPWNPNNLNSINLSNDIKIGRGNPVTSNGGTLYSTYEVAENSSTPVISWKLELGDNESVSSQPSLQVDPDTNKTYLYASTYVTKPAPHSRLYRLDPQTGAPTWKDEPSGGYYKNLGNIHVKGIDQVQLDGQQTTLVSYSDPNNLYTSEGKSLSDVFRDEGKKGEEIFSAPGLGGIFSLKDPPVDVKIESGQFFYWRRYNI